MQPLLLGCFCTVGFVCLLRFFWGGKARNKASKALPLQYICFISTNRSQICIYFFFTFFANFPWEPSSRFFKDKKKLKIYLWKISCFVYHVPHVSSLSLFLKIMYIIINTGNLCDHSHQWASSIENFSWKASKSGFNT